MLQARVGGTAWPWYGASQSAFTIENKNLQLGEAIYPSRASEASEAWRFVGSESCSLLPIGSHMAGPIWLKLAGLVGGNSVTILG